ncbi:MAG: protein-glutamate O-methyltransferase CheR [Syntrophomonas sp.]|nr:protein-glutamate O-methyltransferase CheR [Syntrophomonas sp.]
MIPISEQELQLLHQYVYDYCGIALNKKKHLVEGRLYKLLREEGFNSYSSYYNYLLNDKSGAVIKAVIDQISTNHTFFMRENKHFSIFKDQVLPHLKATVKNRDLRIWSAGCSSGEEPYTLAMIIADFFAEDKAIWDKRILATDISIRALEKAKAGMYNTDEMKSLPENWRLSYFNKIDTNKYQVNDKLKKEIIFRRFNLMDKEFPFKKKFHVIFCRNVMIYFDNATKNDIINRFYDYTEPGGYLFIGHSEALNRSDTNYKYVMPAVYRKG